MYEVESDDMMKTGISQDSAEAWHKHEESENDLHGNEAEQLAKGLSHQGSLSESNEPFDMRQYEADRIFGCSHNPCNKKHK